MAECQYGCDDCTATKIRPGGAAKADVAALTRLIAQVSVLATHCRAEISEIELYPVLAHLEGQGVTSTRWWWGRALTSQHLEEANLANREYRKAPL
jgi:hypothetical protein